MVRVVEAFPVIDSEPPMRAFWPTFKLPSVVRACVTRTKSD